MHHSVDNPEKGYDMNQLSIFSETAPNFLPVLLDGLEFGKLLKIIVRLF